MSRQQPSELNEPQMGNSCDSQPRRIGRSGLPNIIHMNTVLNIPPQNTTYSVDQANSAQFEHSSNKNYITNNFPLRQSGPVHQEPMFNCNIISGQKYVTQPLALVCPTHDQKEIPSYKKSILPSSLTIHDLSLVVRKPVFGVSDQVRHKPGFTATEDG